VLGVFAGVGVRRYHREYHAAGRPYRAGHSVEVLLKVCAKCIDGRRDEINRAI
jgi:hypothetical protein